MPQAKFDNLNDVNSKFINTICYHEDEPVFVKATFHGDDDPKKFILSVAKYGEESKLVEVHDPAFRYRDYNLGYCNHGTATWWYRRPSRQYQQGLKPEQVRFYTETGYGQPKSNFGFIKPYIAMLRNQYMSLEEAKKLTRDGKANVAAWNRDFALQWIAPDNMYHLEYRGSRIGALNVAGNPILKPEALYLKEALQEAWPE
jgi:hypothetical protein